MSENSLLTLGVPGVPDMGATMMFSRVGFGKYKLFCIRKHDGGKEEWTFTFTDEGLACVSKKHVKNPKSSFKKASYTKGRRRQALRTELQVLHGAVQEHLR